MSDVTSIADLLTDNLDIWTSAIERRSTAGRGRSKKFNLYGIEKLRALILDLAVRGKLVPQVGSEESVLDFYINEPRSENLPVNWRVLNFGKFCDIEGGNQPAKSQFIDMPREGYIQLFQIRDLGERGVPTYIPMETARSLCTEGDILIGRYGASVGKVFWAQTGAYNVAMVKFVWPQDALIARFAFLLLQSDFLQAPLAKATRSAQAGFNKDDLSTIDFPLPPLAEQYRIVAKVDELMALCDRLEAGAYDAIAAHQLLVSQLLATLTSAKNTEDFAQSWQRIEANFDTLFTTEDSIETLKQTILQLAVMGMLVPQDPNDEPALELLKQIKLKKIELAKHKKIKKPKQLLPITSDELPFTLPNGWAWARFGDVVETRVKLVNPKDYAESWQVAPDMIEKGTGRLLEKRTVSESGVNGPNSLFESGQIIYSKIRPSLSKAVKVDFDGLCSADMYPLDSFIFSDFLLQLILSEVFLVQVRIAENRIKMPKLNLESLNSFLLPIPPSTEQHRIAAKIDELMMLCDTLKSQITQAQNQQIQFADAVASRAVA